MARATMALGLAWDWEFSDQGLRTNENDILLCTEVEEPEDLVGLSHGERPEDILVHSHEVHPDDPAIEVTAIREGQRVLFIFHPLNSSTKSNFAAILLTN
jgi:hypothetical protein